MSHTNLLLSQTLSGIFLKTQSAAPCKIMLLSFLGRPSGGKINLHVPEKGTAALRKPALDFCHLAAAFILCRQNVFLYSAKATVSRPLFRSA